jgi:hypothetical protein
MTSYGGRALARALEARTKSQRIVANSVSEKSAPGTVDICVGGLSHDRHLSESGSTIDRVEPRATSGVWFALGKLAS